MAGGVIKSKLNRSNGSAQHGKSVISVARKCDSEKFGTGTFGICLLPLEAQCLSSLVRGDSLRR